MTERIHLAVARTEGQLIRLRLNTGTAKDIVLEMTPHMAATIAAALAAALASAASEVSG